VPGCVEHKLVRESQIFDSGLMNLSAINFEQPFSMYSICSNPAPLLVNSAVRLGASNTPTNLLDHI
jgi:hypothetical protein